MLLKHRDKKSLRFELIEPQRVCVVSVNNEICRVGVVKNGYRKVLSRQGYQD